MRLSLRAWLAPRRENERLRTQIAHLWKTFDSETSRLKQLHERQVTALNEDLAVLRGFNDEMKKLGLFFRENYAEQIQAGAHDGLSLSECVIAYLQGRPPKAKQQEQREETHNAQH
jgi:hypothetical protein